MTQSTITDRFQTTIPVEVRQALNLSPRQRVSYEVRPDGSAVNVGFADAFLAAGAMAEKVPVASFDRDFDKLKGMTRFEPTV